MGDCVGPYRFQEQVGAGAGGFGLVFIADQAEPVRRNVATRRPRDPAGKTLSKGA